jgi:metal-responsive CopG/Arc/MetJ family transcriptional regulator
MKIKTSITLSRETLGVLDARARLGGRNRSELIELAIQDYLKRIVRNEQNVRDLQIINQKADDLNREAADVLEFQAPL